ncbi:MAG: glycoside hydrolase family 10 protein [Thermoguttaceae bacterium]|jgi:uncharacterized lipoprotein YddW (UPF0748 family)
MTKRLRLIALAVCIALVSCFYAGISVADDGGYTEESARELFLSEDFFDSFYGADAVELIDFSAVKNTAELPFKSQPNADRGYLDLPFTVDCTNYFTFELIAEVDNPAAVGSITLYFHSGNGWYNLTGNPTLSSTGRVAVMFSMKGARTEGAPDALDKIDTVRFAIWRGGDVDGTVTFKSFKALRCNFAVLDGYEGSDLSYIGSTAGLFARCGLPCERLDVSAVTPENLANYKAILLAIGGQFSDETLDALSQYVDNGGFLFLCYNAPATLLNKLGINSKGFVSCRAEGLEFRGMSVDPKLAAEMEPRGFSMPPIIWQNSWNFYDVEVDESFEANRISPITGDKKAHVLATWQLKDESATEYPALVISPYGMYCSHVLMSDGFDSKRALLSAIGFAVAPESARIAAHQKWVDAFSVGLEPDADRNEARTATLNFFQKELRAKNRTLAQAADFLSADSDITDPVLLNDFNSDLTEIKEKLVQQFVSSQPSRPNEGRLWWEHSGCGIWHGDWDRTMEALSDAGFNGVIPNLLWGGSAYYNSKVLPIAPLVERYGDQIEQAVAAGKKYGVEVHAWMVCFNASNSSKEFLDQMSSEGRLQRTSAGEERPWLCPSDPRNRELQRAALEEVAFNYDVDGVHFDYIRFPDNNSCFCDGCQERFGNAYKEATGQTLSGDFVALVREDSDVGDAWKQWRCDQITALVREVSESLRARRPEIQISAAVFAGYPGVKDSIGQDWALWVDKGWLDFICPMNYTSDPGVFANYVDRQLPYTKGKCPIYPGIGMTATGISMSPEEVVLQAKIAREHGAQGFCVFNLMESSAKAALPAFKAGTTATKTPRRADQ